MVRVLSLPSKIYLHAIVHKAFTALPQLFNRAPFEFLFNFVRLDGLLL